MKIFKKTIPLDCNIFLFGDLHIGSRLVYEKGIDSLIVKILHSYEGLPASKNFALNHGDDIEAIVIDDKRFDLETTKEISVLAQCEYVIKKLKPIKKHLIAILDGNHPRKLWKFGNLAQFIANELNTIYGTWSVRINYQDKKSNLLFKHYAAHGFGTIQSKVRPRCRSEVNKRIKLVSLLEGKAGDCALMSMGHTHQLLVKKPEDYLFITDDGHDLVEAYIRNYRVPQNSFYLPEDQRFYVNTGTFLRTFLKDVSGYGEIKGYDPIQLGYAVALVRGGKIVDVKIELVG